MDTVHALFLGIIQGLTEFLPISSSGHLLLYHEWVGSSVADDLAFDASLHLGTLAAILWYFWRDFVRLLRAWIASLRERTIGSDTDRRLAWSVILGTIPAGIVGATVGNDIEAAFRTPMTVAVTLVIGAVGLALAERFGKKHRSLATLCLSCAMVVGVFQVFALIPGVSRSGATIIAGLLIGLNREAAARFAFYLAAPIVLLAGGISFFNLLRASLTANDVLLILVGIGTSAVVGYLTIRWLLGYLQRSSLMVFVWYRIALAAVVVIVLTGIFS